MAGRSGKGSRQRRIAAVDAAERVFMEEKGALYKRSFVPCGFDARQVRIFERYYTQLHEKFGSALKSKEIG